MRHIFIVNPTAGKRDSSVELLPLIKAVCERKGLDYATEVTRSPLHALEIVDSYARQHDEALGELRFYACGGDGTLSEVMGAAYRYPFAQVAVVPCGSGNDLIKNFGTHQDFLNLPDIIDGEELRIDLMEVENRVCINICSVGLDAAVAHGIPKYRRLPLIGGKGAYSISIVEQLLRPLGNPLSIEIDGQLVEGNYLLAAFANGVFYGGGFKSAPVAEIDDGLLDIILVDKISRLRIASVIAKYRSGKHFDGQKIVDELCDVMTYTRGTRVSVKSEQPFVFNIDGECAPRHEIELAILPRAGRLVLPRELVERYNAAKAQA